MSDEDRIRKVDALTQIITTYAGGGIGGTGTVDSIGDNYPCHQCEYGCRRYLL